MSLALAGHRLIRFVEIDEIDLVQRASDPGCGCFRLVLECVPPVPYRRFASLGQNSVQLGKASGHLIAKLVERSFRQPAESRDR